MLVVQATYLADYYATCTTDASVSILSPFQAFMVWRLASRFPPIMEEGFVSTPPLSPTELIPNQQFQSTYQDDYVGTQQGKHQQISKWNVCSFKCFQPPYFLPPFPPQATCLPWGGTWRLTLPVAGWRSLPTAFPPPWGRPTRRLGRALTSRGTPPAMDAMSSLCSLPVGLFPLCTRIPCLWLKTTRRATMLSLAAGRGPVLPYICHQSTPMARVWRACLSQALVAVQRPEAGGRGSQEAQQSLGSSLSSSLQNGSLGGLAPCEFKLWWIRTVLSRVNNQVILSNFTLIMQCTHSHHAHTYIFTHLNAHTTVILHTQALLISTNFVHYAYATFTLHPMHTPTSYTTFNPMHTPPSHTSSTLHPMHTPTSYTTFTHHLQPNAYTNFIHHLHTPPSIQCIHQLHTPPSHTQCIRNLHTYFTHCIHQLHTPPFTIHTPTS